MRTAYLTPLSASGPALSRGPVGPSGIGWGLSDLGYRGIFGVDFAGRGDTVAALEINPRMQGSAWLLGEVERAEGQLPTMVRHMLERHDHTTPPNLALSPPRAPN